MPQFRLLVFQRAQRRAPDDRDLVPGVLVGGQQLPHLQLDQVQQLRVVHHVHLVQKHDNRRNPTWRANRICSRVCGIGPSAADTTRIAPSICAAPVIMFFT